MQGGVCVSVSYLVSVYVFKDTAFSMSCYRLLLTDERPYRCNQCGLAFRESGALTRHLKSLTPCTEKIRYSQCKEILVSKDGVRKGNSHLMKPFHNDFFRDRRVVTDLFTKKRNSDSSFLSYCDVRLSVTDY